MQCSSRVIPSAAMKRSLLSFFALFLVLAVFAGNVLAAPVVYFSDNFESWTVHGGAWSSVNNETAGNLIDTSTDFARVGSKSLKCTDTDSSFQTERT